MRSAETSTTALTSMVTHSAPIHSRRRSGCCDTSKSTVARALGPAMAGTASGTINSVAGLHSQTVVIEDDHVNVSLVALETDGDVVNAANSGVTVSDDNALTYTLHVESGANADFTSLYAEVKVVVAPTEVGEIGRAHV